MKYTIAKCSNTVTVLFCFSNQKSILYLYSFRYLSAFV